MRTLKFLLQKEFRQIFRNKNILRMIFMVPVIQLIILPQAANYTIKNINIAVVDLDRSSYSQKFVNKVLSSGYFKLAAFCQSYDKAYHLIENDKADIIIEIPQGFESKLNTEQAQTISLSVDAINGVKAAVGSGYLTNIIQDFNSQIRLAWVQPSTMNQMPTIDVASSNWYNPHLSYYLFMVPGILVLLVTLVGGNMTAQNIVAEKESGTIEQINVTPVKKYQFLLGKLIPFWVLGVTMFTLGLLIAWAIYGIIPLGSIPLLYLFVTVYLIAIMGFGLLISTYSETPIQANSLIFFFLQIFNMMGGLYTPIDSMPGWAKVITEVIPISYFIQVMRMIVIKGSQFHDILPHILIVLLMGIILNTWAILNYRKTT
ncbi:MAG TPA: ABC transporter permease [Bacteroidia bacterium]|jgi:ABC-2 type transport system permease protein|nr:ABC transporter permease [Bacteroidia bacterium]